MFKRFKSFTGRARFWALTSICLLAIHAGLYAVVATVNETSRSPVNVPAMIVSLIGLFVLVAGSVSLLVVGVRRLHEHGKSGFWIVPYYLSPGILVLLADGPETQFPALSFIALAIVA